MKHDDLYRHVIYINSVSSRLDGHIVIGGYEFIYIDSYIRKHKEESGKDGNE